MPFLFLLRGARASESASSPQNQTWQVTLTVSQLVYDGGATIASRRAARINEDQAYYTLRDTIDTVVQTVRTQFYQILLNKAFVQVQEESVNLLQSQLEDQKAAMRREPSRNLTFSRPRALSRTKSRS